MGKNMKILVTGGAGFIGSAFCRLLLKETDHKVLNFDKLTYAADLRSLHEVDQSPNYRFVQGDILDRAALDEVFEAFEPDAIVHLAAESHVDRSITGAGAFVQTNVVGTFTLLEAVRAYLDQQGAKRAGQFRFLHVSTDEVYGSLQADRLFVEDTPYAPNSPYSASKAASDHLVRAWHHTYGLPTLMTNCSNNFGPYQFPEKLIPLMIINGLKGEALPIYGTGINVRDWLYVEDHARALLNVLMDGRIGEKYLIGGGNEKTNIQVVEQICDLLDLADDCGAPSKRTLIQFVRDRPGHDARYAVDSGKIMTELGWQPRVSFDEGLAETVHWYKTHPEWWEPLLKRSTGGPLLDSPLVAQVDQ